MDWLPISAAALLTGATALFFGAQMIPRPSGDGDLLRLAHENPDQWVALAILLTVAALGLVVGVPSLFTLFQRRGFRTGLGAAVCLCIGAVMLAAMAQVLVVFRALALNDRVTTATIQAVVDDPLQRWMVLAGFGVFYLGELLLALALLRARTTPAWVPWTLLLHLALVPTTALGLPELARDAGALFLAAGLVGAGVSANRVGRA